MGETKRNIVGFKKFSDLKSSKVEEVDLGLTVDNTLPANPNLHKDTSKVEVTTSKKNIITEENPAKENEETDKLEESSVKTYGKVAKFPKNVKASKAYNFLENVKVSKKSIWYIMVEKQDSELQMIKYNHKEGVDLFKFVNELKNYYTKKYVDDKNMTKLIENIRVDGNDKYSMIKNIPLVDINGKKMITKVTEDLIKLLSK